MPLTNPYKQIRSKVLLHRVYLPLFGLIVFLVLSYFNDFALFYITMAAVYLLSIIIELQKRKEKYLTSLDVASDGIRLSFFDYVPKIALTTLLADKPTEFELVRANWLSEFSPTLHLRIRDEWVSFKICSKSLERQIQKDLSAANIPIAYAPGRTAS